MKNLLILLGILAIAGAALLWWEGQELPSDSGVDVAPLELEEQGTRAVTVFFGDPQGEGIVGEKRVIRTQRHRDEEIELVVAELLAGPTTAAGVMTVPEGTRLRRAFYDDSAKVLYLDFNRALVAAGTGGSAAEVMTLTTILRTIAVDFPEVEAVQFLVEGLEVETMGGHIDLTHPFRTRDWL